jgi:O-antigen ligase
MLVLSLFTGLLVGVAFSTALMYVMYLLCLVYVLAVKYRACTQQLLQSEFAMALYPLLIAYAIASIGTKASFAAVAHAWKVLLRLYAIPLFALVLESKQLRQRLWNIWLALVVLVAAILVLQQHVVKDNIFTSLFLALAVYGAACRSLDLTVFLQLSFYPLLMQRLMNAAVLVCCGYALYYYSYGRVGQILGLLLFCWAIVRQGSQASTRRWAYVLGILAVSGVSICLLLPENALKQRWQKALDESTKYQSLSAAEQVVTSVGARLQFAKNTWQLIQEKPLLGWGLGSFSQIYNQRFAMPGVLVNNPHNQYLWLWCEVGLLGVLAYLWFWFCCWRLSWRLPWVEQCWMQGLVLAFLLGGCANAWLFDSTSAMLLIALASLSYAGLGRKDEC